MRSERLVPFPSTLCRFRKACERTGLSRSGLNGPIQRPSGNLAWKPALSAAGAQLAVMSSWRRRCSAVSASGLKRGSLPPRRSRSSAIGPPLLLEANGVRRHIEGVQCERHRGEPPHEDGDIDDARFSDQVLCALEQAYGHDARLRECRGELIDNLLPRIVEGGRKVGDQGANLLGWQMALVLADHFMLVVRIGSQPTTVDD